MSSLWRQQASANFLSERASNRYFWVAFIIINDPVQARFQRTLALKTVPASIRDYVTFQCRVFTAVFWPHLSGSMRVHPFDVLWLGILCRFGRINCNSLRLNLKLILCQNQTAPEHSLSFEVGYGVKVAAWAFWKFSWFRPDGEGPRRLLNLLFV